MARKSALNYRVDISHEIPLMSDDEAGQAILPDEDEGNASDHSSAESSLGSEVGMESTPYYLSAATYQDYQKNAKFKVPAIRIRNSTSSLRPKKKLAQGARLRDSSPHPGKTGRKSRSKYEIEVETSREDKKMWRPGSGQSKYTTKQYNKYFQRDTDPFGRNNCGFRDIPSNRSRLDDYVLRDIGGFKTQSFRTHIWRLSQLIIAMIIGLLVYERFYEAEPWHNFPLRMLGLMGFAWCSGFCVTYYAGIAMLYQNYYIKNHPHKFMPKDPTKRIAVDREMARKKELKNHAERHVKHMKQKARMAKVQSVMQKGAKIA